MSKKIAVFGGSFDPVHLGHKKLADFMNERLQLDKMLIIPAASSPFKEKSSRAEDRYNMCRLQFSEEIYEVSDIEIRRGGKSYTVDTLNAVLKSYPGAQLYLIIGSDQLLSFDKWKSFEEILSLATLCAVSREKSDAKAQLEEFCRTRLKRLDKIRLFDFKPLPVASSDIRSALADGKDTSPFLDAAVAEYISRKGLYRGI